MERIGKRKNERSNKAIKIIRTTKGYKENICERSFSYLFWEYFLAEVLAEKNKFAQK